MPRRAIPVEIRLAGKTDKHGPLPDKCPELGPCWTWTGAVASGYGTISFRGKQAGVHRVAYILAHGEIPDGYEIDHLCHPGDGSCPRVTCPHRLCVNPDHLEAVTRRENTRRGASIFGQNLRVTHCPQGHEYTPENTRIRIGRTGYENRSCKECHKLQRRTGKVNPLIAANAAKTHCPKRHEYTPENTIIDYAVGGKKGGRRCRICRREQRQQKSNILEAQLQ